MKINFVLYGLKVDQPHLSLSFYQYSIAFLDFEYYGTPTPPPWKICLKVHMYVRKEVIEFNKINYIALKYLDLV